jgi:hypothetical protein
VGACSDARDEARRTVWGEVRRDWGTLLYRSKGGGGIGCLKWSAMKEAFSVTGYWGNEEGVCHLMGE